MHKVLIGEKYRVPGTSTQLSMQRYRSILQIASALIVNGDVMIGSDQNFNNVTLKIMAQLIIYLTHSYHQDLFQQSRILKAYYVYH